MASTHAFYYILMLASQAVAMASFVDIVVDHVREEEACTVLVEGDGISGEAVTSALIKANVASSLVVFEAAKMGSVLKKVSTKCPGVVAVMKTNSKEQVLGLADEARLIRTRLLVVALVPENFDGEKLDNDQNTVLVAEDGISNGSLLAHQTACIGLGGDPAVIENLYRPGKCTNTGKLP